VDQRRGDTSSAAAGATLAMKAEGSGEMADAAVVLTDSGPVRGTVTDDYRLFRGNPVCSIDGGCASLAASATGAPMDPGKRRHQAGGPMCPQQPSTYAKVANLAEDCLCLNVIIPRAADPQQPRPVMVCIEGDGAMGPAASSTPDGSPPSGTSWW
jgi:para-nitrobenzyl esterase